MIRIGSDNYPRVRGIRDMTDDSVPGTIDAVTWELLNAAGSNVAGPTAMTLISGFTDAYEGLIPDTTSLTENALYSVEYKVQADLSIGNDMVRVIRVVHKAVYA